MFYIWVFMVLVFFQSPMPMHALQPLNLLLIASVESTVKCRIKSIATTQKYLIMRDDATLVESMILIEYKPEKSVNSS